MVLRRAATRSGGSRPPVPSPATAGRRPCPGSTLARSAG